MLPISHVLGQIRHKANHMDDFENFLCIVTLVLFSMLFVRALVALYMGRWNLLIFNIVRSKK